MSKVCSATATGSVPRSSSGKRCSGATSPLPSPPVTPRKNVTEYCSLTSSPVSSRVSMRLTTVVPDCFTCTPIGAARDRSTAPGTIGRPCRSQTASILLRVPGAATLQPTVRLAARFRVDVRARGQHRFEPLGRDRLSRLLVDAIRAVVDTFEGRLQLLQLLLELLQDRDVLLAL